MPEEKIKLVLANPWLFPAPTPHFGFTSLAAYIREKKKNIEISIVEGLDIAEEIIRKNPDIVGFTSNTFSYNRVVDLAKKIRGKINSHFLIGGVHITAMPESLDPIFELGTLGEGENTFLKLLELFEEKGDFLKEELAKISGLVFFSENGMTNTGPAEIIEDIDSLPYAARDLVPMNEVYLKDQFNLFGTKRTATTMTSRGCPYKCRFCGSPVQWGRVRFHSPEYVVGEIEHLVEKYNIDGIMFWDDLFIAPEDRILEIAELVKSKGLHKKIVFTGFARANLINEAVCQALSEMNVKRLIFGFESGSEKILDYLKRSSVTIADNRRAVTLCRKYGITTSSGFIVGTPGETVEDLKMTYDFMKKYPLDNTQIYILTPYPGTEIWKEALEKNLISENINYDDLLVQLKPPTLLDFFRKGKPDILKERVFLNPEYQNNREYEKIIFKLTKLAYWQNLKFYLKRFPWEINLVFRIIKKKVKDILLSNG